MYGLSGMLLLCKIVLQYYNTCTVVCCVKYHQPVWRNPEHNAHKFPKRSLRLKNDYTEDLWRMEERKIVQQCANFFEIELEQVQTVALGPTHIDQCSGVSPWSTYHTRSVSQAFYSLWEWVPPAWPTIGRANKSPSMWSVRLLLPLVNSTWGEETVGCKGSPRSSGWSRQHRILPLTPLILQLTQHYWLCWGEDIVCW